MNRTKVSEKRSGTVIKKRAMDFGFSQKIINTYVQGTNVNFLD